MWKFRLVYNTRSLIWMSSGLAQAQKKVSSFHLYCWGSSEIRWWSNSLKWKLALRRWWLSSSSSSSSTSSTSGLIPWVPYNVIKCCYLLLGVELNFSCTKTKSMDHFCPVRTLAQNDVRLNQNSVQNFNNVLIHFFFIIPKGSFAPQSWTNHLCSVCL